MLTWNIEETTPQSWAVVGATPTQHSLDAQGIAGSSRLVQTVPVGKEGFLFGRPVQSAPVEESSSAGRYSLYRSAGEDSYSAGGYSYQLAEEEYSSFFSARR
ncbi:hypothetical protein PCANC_10808 [Puccinia coronata f. sp. avenae]|uniref:Uncharacterized protein n=1 Tax=Puccinia coronata f. sp. avenae TaxID=200324 RepID=A0A2N5V4F3_9BASI|nr:hypothetical protein PCANC_10808 [Puccinia coronata f. sp. avenae]